MAEPETSGPIKASGCVVYRNVAGSEDSAGASASAGAGTSEVEVLVAHRPRYDDWDFPKGKLEDGETDLECAIRETLEETGYSGVVGDELPADHYVVSDKNSKRSDRGRDKVVRWWLLEQTGGAFVANEEVDEVRWVSPAEAMQLLSYEHAKTLLRFVPGQS